MKILDWSLDQRPRERLMEVGAEGLTNAEIIAILLRTGYGADNALDIAQKILAMGEGRLSRIAEFSMEKLMGVYGVGKEKAAVIIAALELGRRFCSEMPDISKVPFTGPGMVFKMMAPVLKGLGHEQLWGLLLNQSNYLVGKKKVSSGGISATAMDTRSLVMTSLDKKATGVILVHNHPSGNPRPGKADIECTRNVKQALEMFDIRLVDHIIICEDCYYSFHDETLTAARE